MDRRFITFLALSTAVVIANFSIMWWLQKNRPAAPPKAARQAAADERAVEKVLGKNRDKQLDKMAETIAEAKPAGKKLPARPEADARKQPKQEWFTLGSADTADPYRLLATLTNQGAAVVRIELNSPRFHDLEDRSGYIGHLQGAKSPGKPGYLVRVVGAGTPAARAGLKRGDVVTAVDGDAVIAPSQFNEILKRREPGDAVKLLVDRQGKKETLTATLVRRPLEVVRPEGADPLSFLLTLNQIGDETLSAEKEELDGLRLRTANWNVLARDAKRPDEISFEYVLEERQLRVVKTYTLARLKPEEQDNLHAPAYHLKLRVAVENTGDESRQVAYRLDGPTGLPIEGWWYALNSKIGHSGSPGMRDLSLGRITEKGFQYDQINAVRFADDDLPKPYTEVNLAYVGVDAQYVAAMLIPQAAGDAPPQFESVLPIRVGPVPDDKNKKKLVDISCRLISKPAMLEPNQSFSQEFQIFAGPKRPDLLAQYAPPHGLGELVYYGWFGWVSVPMLHILHFFYAIVGNYGLAIVMLTVLVRSCMFPLSRKQALNAAKMQELQPEIKKLAEKYKNPEERMKAQREFFRKHNYHPLSGCLPALVQLPIFLGLYRSLAVDIELRQAPLISESVRWCSNLGAPDMLWYWKPYLPIPFLTDEAAGWLGPYLNVLPLATIALFIVQQKMFLPPPTDEQSAMQQKMMQYMMIFMGVMFFKVASGLCLYFIASSLWGIAERKLLPKPAPKPGEAPARLPSSPGPNGSGGSSKKAKQRNRK